MFTSLPYLSPNIKNVWWTARLTKGGEMISGRILTCATWLWGGEWWVHRVNDFNGGLNGWLNGWLNGGEWWEYFYLDGWMMVDDND